MTQEQADAVLGRLMRKRTEAQKHLALLQEEARELSKQFGGLAETLKPDKVWNIAPECYQPLLSEDTYEKIKKLRIEVPRAEQELAQLNGELAKFNA